MQGLCPQCMAKVVFGPSGEAARVIPLSEKPGDRIGRYKLLQQIGEGACGVM